MKDKKILLIDYPGCKRRDIAPVQKYFRRYMINEMILNR